MTPRAPTEDNGWTDSPFKPFETLVKPTSKQFKDAELYWVRLEDECPSIGSGVRRVYAAVGRKWVYLCGSFNRRGKVSREIWESLKEKSS